MAKPVVKSIKIQSFGRTQNVGSFNSTQCYLGVELEFPEGANSEEMRSAVRGALQVLNEEIEREMAKRALIIKAGRDAIFNEFAQIDPTLVPKGYAPK